MMFSLEKFPSSFFWLGNSSKEKHDDDGPVVRHPQPVVRHPEPVVRHPQPSVRHPQAVDRHPQPVARHPQPREISQREKRAGKFLKDSHQI